MVWFSVVVQVRATPGSVVQCGGAGEGYTRWCGSVRGAGEGYTGWCGSVWWCR